MHHPFIDPLTLVVFVSAVLTTLGLLMFHGVRFSKWSLYTFCGFCGFLIGIGAISMFYENQHYYHFWKIHFLL